MATETKTSSRAKVAPRRRRITFGSVTVLADIPPESEIKKNIAEGRDVLSRLFERLQKPGVQIEFQKDVPYFHADPENPSRLIRTLNGNQEPVIFEGGRFVVCK